MFTASSLDVKTTYHWKWNRRTHDSTRDTAERYPQETKKVTHMRGSPCKATRWKLHSCLFPLDQQTVALEFGLTLIVTFLWPSKGRSSCNFRLVKIEGCMHPVKFIWPQLNFSTATRINPLDCWLQPGVSTSNSVFTPCTIAKDQINLVICMQGCCILGLVSSILGIVTRGGV